MPNTQSKEVNLTKRVQTLKGMRYCPVVLSPNGRVKPDLVLVNRKQERHPEGAYYLEWREKGRRVRLSVGKDGQEAAARRQRKQAELNAPQQRRIRLARQREGRATLDGKSSGTVP